MIGRWHRLERRRRRSENDILAVEDGYAIGRAFNRELSIEWGRPSQQNVSRSLDERCGNTG